MTGGDVIITVVVVDAGRITVASVVGPPTVVNSVVVEAETVLITVDVIAGRVFIAVAVIVMVSPGTVVVQGAAGTVTVVTPVEPVEAIV